jgi:glycosyltransferase involved in cell wall biosynthesis
MQCGAPVIGSNTSSIPEVIGTPDALFDPFDVVSIRDAIDDALKSPAFREKMIEHGAQRAAFFSWDRVGSESIKAFEGAVFTKNKTPQFRTPVTPPSSVEGASADCRIAAIEAVRLFLADRCATPAQEARVGWQASLPKISNSELATVAKSIALNHPQRIMKQLFVDVSELVNHDARTGIQRVVRSVLSELMSFPPEGFQIEPVYATPNGTGYRYARTFVNKVFGGLYTAFPDDIVDMQGGDIFLGLDLQHSVVLAQENTYSEFRNSGVEVYFVVYDLLPILLREKFPAGAAALHDQWLTAISRADGLVCISRSVADELITWLDQHGVARNRPLKIGWFHLGADMQQSLPSKGASSDASILNGLTKLPTFLMVGTLEPRKGHFQTVSAFERLWADGHDVNLVIVGKQGWNVDKLVRTIKGSRELGHRLLWLPSASDEYLETLYANSDCLIAASEGEGFGLPLVEAAQHGIPIFARALPVFQELAGGAAFYFEGSDATSMADALTEWLGQFAEGKAPASRNMPLLTWKQSTAQLMNTIIKKDWYQTWVSADGWRYKASDLAMHTIVGRRVGQEMHTSGQAGFFLFGPYVTLSPGKYGFRLYGSYDGSGKATYDLVGNHGSIVLEETTLKKHPQWGEMVSFDFTIEDEIGQFEMRMKVDRFANLSVSRLELFPIDFADE